MTINLNYAKEFGKVISLDELSKNTGIYINDANGIVELNTSDVIGELVTKGKNAYGFLTIPVLDAPTLEEFTVSYLDFINNGFWLVENSDTTESLDYFYKDMLTSRESDIKDIAVIYEKSKGNPKLFRAINIVEIFSEFPQVQCPNLTDLVSRLPEKWFTVKLVNKGVEQELPALERNQFISYIPLLSNDHDKITITEGKSNNVIEMNTSVNSLMPVIRELANFVTIINILTPIIAKTAENIMPKLNFYNGNKSNNVGSNISTNPLD